MFKTISIHCMCRTLFVSFSVLSLLCACTQDAYDQGTGTYSLTQADFVEAHADANGLVDYVLTDDGDSLALTTPQNVSWVQRKDSVYRALFYYNKVAEHEAENVAFSYVYTLTAVATSQYKRITTDPVDFESAWISKNQRYLNFSLLFKSGYADHDVTGQTIGLGCDSIHTNADGTKTAYYVFLHSQEDVPEYFTVKAYISVPIATVDADSIAFTLNTYQSGIVQKRIALHKN